MTERTENILFACYGIFCVAWLAGIAWLSIRNRRTRGKPIRPRVPSDAVFAEKGASGRDRGSAIRSMGGARNCLIVAVTRDRLSVQPSFPFNLMFMPEIWGLELNASLRAIRFVERSEGLLGQSVTVYCNDGGGERRFELRLKNTQGFLNALGKVDIR